ncbi:hypothetical protein A2U01_0098010, partial [Trifolium medium]|nr:hypothetical protein [Trifolium medium]
MKGKVRYVIYRKCARYLHGELREGRVRFL